MESCYASNHRSFLKWAWFGGPCTEVEQEICVSCCLLSEFIKFKRNFLVLEYCICFLPTICQVYVKELIWILLVEKFFSALKKIT